MNAFTHFVTTMTKTPAREQGRGGESALGGKR